MFDSSWGMAESVYRQVELCRMEGSFVMYGADGRFDRTWTPPIVSGAFPNISAFTYLDAEVIAGYYSASDSLPARVALFRGNEIIRVDSLLMGQSEENGVAGVNDIAMISVLKDGDRVLF